MSLELKKLQEERAEAVTAMHALVEAAEKEDRGLTAEERESWDKMDESIEAYDNRIEIVKRSESLYGQLDQVNSNHIGREQANEGQQTTLDEQRAQTFDKFLRFGASDLGKEERQILRGMRFVDEQRAQSVGTTTAGGHTVPSSLANQIEDAKLAFGGIRKASSVITTGDGGTMTFVTDNDTGNSGALIAENTADSEQDLTFGTMTLGAYKYTSKIIRVSNELLQDSAFDMNAYIAGKFGERLGRIEATHLATGSGSGQPNGLVTASTLGVTAAATAAITYNELLDLKHSVDPAYRSNARWVFKDSTFKAVKKLADSNGLPLWSPDVTADAPATLDGDPYIIDQGLAALATGAKTVLYGDISKYTIRSVKGFTLVRLVERYAEYDQVGFIAYMRMDADLLDAGTNPVKHLIQA